MPDGHWHRPADAAAAMGGGGRVLVSHAGPDTEWAEWVAWHLEAARYQVELDRWDWETGSNFVFKMNAALEAAESVVAIWSAAYLLPDAISVGRRCAECRAAHCTSLRRRRRDPARRSRLVPRLVCGPMRMVGVDHLA
jgi:hypothetical protein